MSEFKAFVYRWDDYKTGKFYIGCHLGQPDDGYICSSVWMLHEYKLRPNDFYRTILYFCKTLNEAVNLENLVHLELNVAKNPQAYNFKEAPKYCHPRVRIPKGPPKQILNEVSLKTRMKLSKAQSKRKIAP